MSNKQQRAMNKTFTVLTNEHYSIEKDDSQEMLDDAYQRLSISDNDRFRTFIKHKVKPVKATIIVNRHQQRYFDSPSMISLDDDDDNDIPVARCSIKTPVADIEKSLNDTELSDLVFVNPNRILSESMQVVTSRHPSLQDLKYISDVSSVLAVPPLSVQDDQEHIYQELIRIEHSITTSTTDDVDEEKENRPPLRPVKYRASRIPIWAPSPKVNINTPISTVQSKRQDGEKKKNIITTNQFNLTDLVDRWSRMMPKLKEILSITRKMPLRISHLSPNTTEFRRLKQLLGDMELISSSWTNASSQCRAVLQQAQQQRL